MKTALITGASMGLGEQFVHILAQKGYRIIMVARSLDKMQAIKNTLEVPARIIVKDLCKEESLQELKEELCYEEIDILINNAGFGDYGHFLDLSEQKMSDMINLNIKTLTQICYMVMPKMKKGSKILNISSMAAFSPGPYFSVYAATKAYVLSFSQALREEYRGKISVTALCPGPTETNFAAYSNMDETALFRFTMNAKEVAEYGIDALLKNKAVAIPGLSNQMLHLGSKLLPAAITSKAISISRSFNK